MPERNQTEIEEMLDQHFTKRVALCCQVGVCIWGEMFTLEPGRGLCRYDLTRDGMRIGIGVHTISKVKREMDGTITITVS